MNFSGHGSVSTEGGSGYGYGFGGAGGRIAVKILWYHEFAGKYIAYGGYGGDAWSESTRGNGAAGTVYFTDNRDGLTSREQVNTTDGLVFKDGFRRLIIDNDNRNEEQPTVIESEYNSYFEFDEVDATNHVVLQMADPDAVLVVHNFLGDRTGQFHLKSGQQLWVEYVASSLGYTVAPVSYRIDANAEVVMPSTVIMLGTRTEVAGRLVNIHNLTIAEGAQTVFYSTAQTAILEDGDYSHETSPGNVTFAALTIQRGSILELTHIDNPLTVHVNTFIVKYEGLVNMNKGHIDSDEGRIESEGIIDINFRGFKEEEGPGAGYTNNSIGYGAAHGGHGGAPYPFTGGKSNYDIF